MTLSGLLCAIENVNLEQKLKQLNVNVIQLRMIAMWTTYNHFYHNSVFVCSSERSFLSVRLSYPTNIFFINSYFALPFISGIWMQTWHLHFQRPINTVFLFCIHIIFAIPPCPPSSLFLSINRNRLTSSQLCCICCNYLHTPRRER